MSLEAKRALMRIINEMPEKEIGPKSLQRITAEYIVSNSEEIDIEDIPNHSRDEIKRTKKCYVENCVVLTDSGLCRYP